MRRIAAASLVVVGLVLGTGAVPPPAGAAGRGHESARATGQVLHRIVWDETPKGVKGIHVRSANLDGTDQRPVYVSHHGFALDLSLDRRGRRVAFAPCCQDRLPRLVVARVMGGRVQKPLAHHPAFYFVGGIGWSPNGRRLVFEGNTGGPRHLAAGLWTVRPNGTGLRRLLRLPNPRTDQSVPDVALAWTHRGVLYCQGDALRVARDGHSRVLARNTYSVRISGNGRHIVTERFSRASSRGSIWYADADGTHARRLWRGPYGTDPGTTIGYPVPDFKGRHVLADRSSDTSGEDAVVDWRVGDKAADAPEVALLSRAFAFTWN